MHKLVEKAEVVRDGWNGFNVLHDTAARVAALDIGFLPSARARASSSERRCTCGLWLLQHVHRNVPCGCAARVGDRPPAAALLRRCRAEWHQHSSECEAVHCEPHPSPLPHPRPACTAAAPKLVYLLGADDFSEADVPADAFVVYQVGRAGLWRGKGRPAWGDWVAGLAVQCNSAGWVADNLCCPYLAAA